MSVTRRNALFAGVASLPAAGLLLGRAAAQQPGQPGTLPGFQPAAQPGAQSGTHPLGDDPLLAACMLTECRKQEEVCRFVKDRCQNEEIKSLVQAEIDGCEKVKADLARIGYQPPTKAAAPGQQPGQPVQQPGQPIQQFGQPIQQAGAVGSGGTTVSVGRVMMAPGVSESIAIESEVADQCIATAKQMLTKKEQEKGKAKMEKAFLIGLLFSRQGELDKLTVFKKHATPELAPVLEKCEQACRSQIATGERILEKLETMRNADAPAGQPKRDEDK